MPTINDLLAEIKIKYKFDQVAATPLLTSPSLDIYKTWLDQNQHASMNYLKEHLVAKENPDILLPGALTAIVFTAQYAPHPEPETLKIHHNKMALYAQGADYHFWFKEQMKTVIVDLKLKYPKHHFIAFTDSAPILERDLAYQAGLGWFGKNSCLIHPKKGSFFHIGEILTTLPLEDQQTAPIHDFCGSCNRCVEACPTQAIHSNKTINSHLCISYLTIESKTNPPENLRAQIGDQLFGCDICQTVCPWNEKQFKNELWFQKQKTLTPVSDGLIAELKSLLSMSGKQFQKTFYGSPFLRAGHIGLKRNAIIVATNLKITELIADIQNHKDHPKLAELCDWSLSILKSSQKV